MDEGPVEIVVSIIAFMSTISVTLVGAWITRRDRRANLERDVQVMKALSDLGGNTDKLAKLVHRHIEDIGVEAAVRQQYSRLVASAVAIVVLSVSAVFVDATVSDRQARSGTVTTLAIAVVLLAVVASVQYGRCREVRRVARGEYLQRDTGFDAQATQSPSPHLAPVDNVGVE